MTKDDPVEELTSDGTQQPQKPFQVILIDIEKASRHHIHCVEKPLEGDTEELSFVALSYRWGEVQESIIDTQLGYIATITSFALNDFYRLCHMMKKEPDLQHIKYVWVDAICVDQTNYERRKATIHKMSNIYEKATFILAVPDLHSEHLQNVYTEHRNFIQFHFDFDEYIYHLIQGNTAQLHHLDSTFLDDDYVPKDRTLRQLLATCTTFLANGFTDLEDHNYYRDEPGEALDLLCEIYHASLPTPDETLDLIKLETQKQDVHDDDDDPESLLHYDKVASLCLLDPYTRWEKIGKCDRRWIHKVMRRSNAIRQLVKFLGDLIVDWSSRVWVISEYNIAKKKNNLKYWFMLLSTAKTSELPFFKFDFTNPAFSSVIQTFRFNFPLYDVDVNPVHLSFHRLIIKQLNTQSFFEMMLKSKASKNEDRFYAILPLSKYKDKLNQVAHWEINHMMSVKLKLFEIMDTKDKIKYVSSVTYILLIDYKWDSIGDYLKEDPGNFYLENESSAITFHRTNNPSLPYYYLRLTPKIYFVRTESSGPREHYNSKTILYNHLQFNKNTVIDLVFVHQYDIDPGSSVTELKFDRNMITLIGSFVENKWILCSELFSYPEYKYRHTYKDYYNHDQDIVFNIY